MAKSKIVKANEKIAEGVTGGFQKMSDGVVGAYKKIENGFVNRYLTKEGESVEDAKARLAEEEAARQKESKAQMEAHRVNTDTIVEDSLRRAKERSRH